VKLLLDKGANAEAAMGDETTVCISAQHGYPKIVSKLLLDKGASTEAATNTGETALDEAVTSKQKAVVKLLTSSLKSRK